jgi:ribosomal protein S18 acetylase RimI-like enzyme
MEIIHTKNKKKLMKTMEKITIESEESLDVKRDYEEFYYEVNDNGKIIGGITGWIVFNEIFILELCVDKNYRKKGIGTQLLKTVEEKYNNGFCDNINLVTHKFTGAVEFYRKCGFNIEFERRNEINPKVNKFFMKKTLKRKKEKNN